MTYDHFTSHNRIESIIPQVKYPLLTSPYSKEVSGNANMPLYLN